MANHIYAYRNADGHISSISLQEDDKHTEVVQGDDEELIAFMQDRPQRPDDLYESDMAFVRVIEDLIEVLVDKDLINFTDLPEAAQSKVLKRRGLRGLNLLGDSKDETI